MLRITIVSMESIHKEIAIKSEELSSMSRVQSCMMTGKLFLTSKFMIWHVHM